MKNKGRIAREDCYQESEYAVRIKNLTKMYKIYPQPWYRVLNAFLNKVQYNKFYAIKNLTIDFPKGETIGILGRNGSGKSTLLKMITGVTNPTKGSIEVNGRISAMLELTSGFDRELTGYENIYLKATAMGISRETIETKVDDIVEFADIGEHISQPVRTYSSGMKSRLGFAISVNVDPDILIVDEVLSVGDEAFRIKCLAKMEEFRKSGKTILFVSHSMFTVKGFCTRAMWVKDGELMEYGETGPVVQRYSEYLKEVKIKQNEKLLEEEIAEEKIMHKSEIIEISKFKFFDPAISEKSTRDFEYGHTLTFQFDYEVKKPLDKILCTFTVNDAEKREIYSSNKRDHNNLLNTEIGKHRVLITILNPKLLPGRYLLAGELWINDSGLYVAYAKRKTFRIFTKKEFKGTGITYLDYKLKNKPNIDEVLSKERS